MQPLPNNATRHAVSDCLLVGKRRSADRVPCEGKPDAEPYIEDPLFSAIIQTFKDGPQQARQLTHRLRAIPLPKEIIVNDDSHGKQSYIWLPLLTARNEFYLSSPNMHEVRAYNRLAQMARGELLVFIQGDCCLPTTPNWMLDAMRIFRALPRLGMLSARVGFSEVLSYQLTSAYRNERTWGAAPYKPLEHTLRAPATRAEHIHMGTLEDAIPFDFAAGVDNGPLLYRRDALLRIGGFDQSFSCAAGHLSGHYDFEASLRFWLHGWQVGVFYGCAVNGIGGRKTMRTPTARNERHSNELWNGRKVEALWRAHNATISMRLAESLREQRLAALPISQRESARRAQETRIGKLTKEQCSAQKFTATKGVGRAALGGGKTGGDMTGSGGNVELGGKAKGLAAKVQFADFLTSYKSAFPPSSGI